MGGEYAGSVGISRFVVHGSKPRTARPKVGLSEERVVSGTQATCKIVPGERLTAAYYILFLHRRVCFGKVA